MMNEGSAFKKANPFSLSIAEPPVKTLIWNQSVKILSLIIRKMLDSDSDIECTAWISDSGVKKSVEIFLLI